MPLDPILQNYIDAKRSDPRFSDLDVATARASRVQSRMQLWPEAAPCTATDLSIPMAWGNCRARFYRPEQADGPLPLVVFFHGGGFVICDLETHDGLARNICGGAGVAVLSVDYRLAPEAPFPAARDDAVISVRWAIGAVLDLGVDRKRIFLCGDSAGGHIAATAALELARGEDAIGLAGLALCYPVADAPTAGHQSYTDFATGYGLTRGDMVWFWNHYMGNSTDPDGVSLLQGENLPNCPPTYVMTAEYDVLRDEGEAFASQLKRSGVDVTASRIDGVNHNFLAFAKDVPQAGAALRELCDWIRARGAI